MTDEQRARAFIGATEMAPDHDAGDLAHALAMQFEVVRAEAQRVEREAVVAFLRRRPSLDALWWSDAIERGEHLSAPPPPEGGA